MDGLQTPGRTEEEGSMGLQELKTDKAGLVDPERTDWFLDTFV